MGGPDREQTARPDAHLRRLRIDAHDIKRLRLAADLEPAALPDGKMDDAGVVAEHLGAGGMDDLAGADALGPQLALLLAQTAPCRFQRDQAGVSNRFHVRLQFFALRLFFRIDGAFGVALGEELLKVKPEGGTYGMISGGAAAPNLALRVDGVREALAGSSWTEVPGSPTFSNDDIALAVQQMGDLKTANPDIKAIVPVGGWPMFAPDGWKNFVDQYKADVDSGALALVVADTLPQQLQLLKEGYAHGLVGQRPYEMGQKAMDTLLAIKNGETVEEIIYTGNDVVTAENVDEFLK